MKKNTKLRLITIFILLIALLFIGCPTSTPKDDDDNSNNNNNGGGAFSITSTAFNDGDAIPVAYRGNFAGPPNPRNNPPLAISNLPAGTKSLVLWLLDTDSTGFAHWIIRNVPITKTTIAHEETFDAGTQIISTYFGPSPPEKHTYTFVVFALSDTTAVKPTGNARDTQGNIHTFYSTDADKIGAINLKGGGVWNVLGTATLTGTFTPP